MQSMNDNIGTPIAKGMNVLLKLIMGLMIFVIIAFITLGVIMISDNNISAEIHSQLEATNDVGAKNPPLVFFGGALIATIWLYVLNILRKIIGTLLKRDPFASENISRLRKIWIVIVISEIIRIVIVNFTRGENMLIEVQASTIFLVFVIAALSEVFRHGAELRRDAKLTI